MTVFAKRILFCLVVVSSCASPEKRTGDEIATESSDTTVANPPSAAISESTVSEKPDSISVALLFINDYIKHVDGPDPFDPMSWVENSELATDEFKASYKKVISKGLEAEPETGLSYDPILNAQDYPVSFEFVRLDDNEYVVVKGTDQPQFLNVLRTKFVIDRWVVDGCGVVNIPEEKRKFQ
jgi:hypothetical protein